MAKTWPGHCSTVFKKICLFVFPAPLWHGLREDGSHLSAICFWMAEFLQDGSGVCTWAAKGHGRLRGIHTALPPKATPQAKMVFSSP